MEGRVGRRHLCRIPGDVVLVEYIFILGQLLLVSLLQRAASLFVSLPSAMASPQPEPRVEPTTEPVELQAPKMLGYSGYQNLAEMMSLHPELCIVRRFGCLFTEMILYYQAEITVLEARLREVRAQDKVSVDVNRQRYGLSWVSLSLSSSAEEGSPEREHFDIIMRLRKIMPEYCLCTYPMSRVQIYR